MLLNSENEMDKNRIELPSFLHSHERKNSSSLQTTDIHTFNETEKQRHFQIRKEKRLPADHGHE